MFFLLHVMLIVWVRGEGHDAHSLVGEVVRLKYLVEVYLGFGEVITSSSGKDHRSHPYVWKCGRSYPPRIKEVEHTF